jgi:hypothetical protein
VDIQKGRGPADRKKDTLGKSHFDGSAVLTLKMDPVVVNGVPLFNSLASAISTSHDEFCFPVKSNGHVENSAYSDHVLVGRYFIQERGDRHFLDG